MNRPQPTETLGFVHGEARIFDPIFIEKIVRSVRQGRPHDGRNCVHRETKVDFGRFLQRGRLFRILLLSEEEVRSFPGGLEGRSDMLHNLEYLANRSTNEPD